MKLIKTVKKIMALGTGAAMMGATLSASAFAADLADYPAPFVQDGKFNGVIVVGDNAMSADVLGSVDIATSLQFASRVRKTVKSQAGGTVSVSGEAWRVGTSSKKLEMSELGTGKKEAFRNITTFITEDELPTLLADGTFRNSRGDYDYHQYLYFDNVNSWTNDPISLSVVHDKSSDGATDGQVGAFLYAKDGEQLARYSLEFTTAAESEVTDSAGTASTSGLFLWDLEGKDINMMGKTFSIVKARRNSATGNSATLTLMGGATRDILDEGESKTYTIGGKDFEVSLDFVGSTTAKFRVNSELTDSLQEGDTYTLSDKSLVGVKDISVQDFAGGVRKVEFFLGADKIVLKDGDVSDSVSDTAIEVAQDTLDDTEVIIAATDDNTTFKITSIELNVSADDDMYIAAGGKVSEYLEAPGVLMGAWDIDYQGLEDVPVETIKLSPSSDQYNLQFVDGDGKSVSVPIAYTSGGSNLKAGDDDDDFIINENATISKDDYFILSDYSQQLGERSTYAFRYKGAAKNDTSGDKVIKFDKLGQGTIERPLTTPFSHEDARTTANSPANIQAGGATFRIWATSAASSKDFDIVVDLDGDGTHEADQRVNITTKAGAEIALWARNATDALVDGNVSANPTHVEFSLNTVDSDDYDNVAPSPVEFNITAASGEVAFSEIPFRADHNYKSPEGETTLNYAYTSLGAYVTWENPTNDPDILTVEYPTVQRTPLVYITGQSASISKGEATEAGDIVYYETTPIAVGSAKLASEIANVAGQNVIAVGGPCANAVAAELMGNPANCAAGFTPGKGMVKLVEHANGNVGMVVAGFSAADTRRASRVVANYEEWQDAGSLAGMEVEVSGTSFTDISVAAPSPVEEEEEAAAEEEATEEGSEEEAAAADAAGDETTQ